MTDLSDLFARDPLALTREDRRVIIERMRQAQANFELGLKSPVAPRQRKSPAKADILAELGLAPGKDKSADILKDLGLDKG